MQNFLRRTALLVGGAVLTILVLYFVNPLLPEQISLGITKPAPEDTSTEGVSITYTIPSDEEMDTATSFDGYVPPDQLLTESINVPLPLAVVSQDYINAFNELVNQGARLEAHLKTNVAPAMLQVQTEATAGNFLKMFEHMVEAREQLRLLNNILEDLNMSLLSYRSAYQVSGTPVVVRNNSKELDQSVVTLYEETKKFGSLLEQTVNGTVPSQSLVTETEMANRRVVAAAEAVVKSITAVGEAVKIPLPQP